MQYGRIVRITYTLGEPYATYIVAEENAAKATAMMKSQVGVDAKVECIGRASKELLHAMACQPASSKRWTRSYERPGRSHSRGVSSNRPPHWNVRSDGGSWKVSGPTEDRPDETFHNAWA
jgi:hypothetical protein